MNKKQINAQKKVIRDMIDQFDETKRMRREKGILWKLRGLLSYFEYWCIAYGFYISIGLWIVTGDYWKGIAFYFVTQVYALSGNFRGMSLHIENLVEWIIKKTV